MTVYGSMQCPYYVHRALTVLLGLPGDRVRVVQTETGGGFGGKEEYPSHIACHAALLARKAGRPVKLIYDREEDLLATTKRHPSIVRHRTGVMKDGRLVAMDIDVVLDAGAYCTLSPVVLSRGILHATGPYRCPHVRIRGRALRTNTPPNGAFRGFGAPQTQFGAEVHMDRIAHALGIDPVKLRLMNAFKPGDTTATGQVLPEDTSALPVLREAVKRTSFARKRRQWQGTDKSIGLSLFFHGAGFHRYRRSQARVEGVAAVDRDRRSHSRRVDRDRAGHAHDARADRGRRARSAVRRGGSVRGGHGARAGQRADSGVAHVHGGGPAARTRRASDEGASRPRDARVVFHEARFVRRDHRVRASTGSDLGRGSLPGRRVRKLRLGMQCRRARARSHDVGRCARPR